MYYHAILNLGVFIMGFLDTLKRNKPARKKDILKLIDFNKDYSELILRALADPNGPGKLDAMMHNAYMPRHYWEIFHQMYVYGNAYSNDGIAQREICIDCGGHIGVFTDVALHCGAIVYVFEPNKYLFAFLQNKYRDNPNVILHNQAVSNRNYQTQFLIDEYGELSQGNRIVESVNHTQKSYEVEVIDLSQYIKEHILPKHNKISFLKLDVEGSEFDIMESLLGQDLHKHIGYIACETHERFFSDGEEKLAKLKQSIEEKSAKNVFLDWI